MAENFEGLRNLGIIAPALADRMTKAVGFRNIAVHSCQRINGTIVYQICRHHVDDFRQFVQTVAARLRR